MSAPLPLRKAAMLLTATLFVFIALQAWAQPQYCRPNFTGSCTPSTLMKNIRVLGTNFAPPNAACGARPTADFLPIPGEAAILRLEPGGAYIFEGLMGVNSMVTILWIDWDLNGQFDPSDSINLGQPAANTTFVVPFTVPPTAVPGYRIARLRYSIRNAQGFRAPCGTMNSGVSQDFHCLIEVPSSPCNAPLPTVNLGITRLDMCPGDSVTLTGAAPWVGSGLQFLWQTSTDSINWTAAPGLNNGLTYVLQGTAVNPRLYARMLATCVSGTAQGSSVARLTRKAADQCGCTPVFTNQCQTTGLVTRLYAANGWNAVTPTVCRPNLYFDFRGEIDTLRLQQGTALRLGGTVGSRPFNYMLWIDYNHDGSFTASEATPFSNVTFTSFETTLNVPATALLGTTSARLMASANYTLTTSDACRIGIQGLTIDFMVNVAPSGACLLTAPSIRTDTSLLCSGNSTRVLATRTAQFTPGARFVWQTSTDNGQSWLSRNGGADTANITVIPAAELPVSGPLQVRFQVSCPGASAVSVTSNVLSFSRQVPTRCYCPPVHSVCLENHLLISVRGSGSTPLDLNIPTSCPPSGGAYAFGGGANDTLHIMDGASNNMVVEFVTTTSPSVFTASLWIDYNMNGVFDASEWHNVTRSTNSGQSVQAVINHGALIPPGINVTMARLRTRQTVSSNIATDACTSMGSGQSYDFPVVMRRTSNLGGSQQLVSSLFPNPATNTLHIGLVTEYPAVSFQLRDMTGKLIATPPATSHGADYELDLGSVTPGIYQLVVQAGQGVELQTVRKVVVQR